MPVSSYARPRSSVERNLKIDEFLGIDQGRGVFSNRYDTSPDAMNFIARDGALRVAGGTTQYGPALPYTPAAYTPQSKPRLLQAYFKDANGEPVAKLIASFNRQLFAYNPGTNTWSVVGTTSMDGCDLVNYRFESSEWAILSDGAGELKRWDGTGTGFVDLNVVQGTPPEEIKFEQIALLYERLWGGVTKGAPDRIFWSGQFSPDDWDFASNPEDGGGFVDVATFDGSKIRAIVPAMDDVLIFKDSTVHRLSGTYPGEFALSQVSGASGTLSPRTIVNAGTRVFFLSSDGLCTYDGMSVTPLKNQGDRKLKDAWAAMDHAVVDKACAAVYQNVVYLAVGLDPEVSYNTHVIEFDIATGQYSMVALTGVDDIMVFREGQKETLLVMVWDKVYRYDSGATLLGQPINAYWTSPEIVMGSMASKKATGQIYMVVEASSLDVEVAPRMKFSVTSGNKTATKIIPLKVGLNTIRTRVKRRGRGFSFKIENMDGNPLTIRRGIEIMVEEDPD